MLQVASFEISDAEGMNALLTTKKLATGMHILVSNGKVCIPYEDGTPPTNAIKLCQIGEQVNAIVAQMDIIEHSQLVMDRLLADALERKNAAEAAHKAATSDKKLEAKFKEAEGAHNETANQILMNKSELTRLQFNLDFYDAQVKKLSA